MTEYNGPWTAPSAGVYGADGLLICSFGGRDVIKAYRKRGDTNGAVLTKYAQVAAAAPELLAALKACHLQMLQSNNDSEYAQEANQMAIAAVAKAEGK